MAARRQHDWWPYLAPYGLFLMLVEVGARVPPETLWVVRVLRVVLPGLLVLHFARRGRYPELAGYRPGAGGLAADVAVGVLIAALWMGPYLLFPSLSRPDVSEGFDPAAIYGAGREALGFAVRLAGFAVVTPFVEELFVRSFLHRLVDVVDTHMDFRKVPVAHYTRRGFVTTVAWFTLTHVTWEWPVALVAGVVFNLWLYRRGHIGAVIVAHAAANAAIWLAVVLGPDGWRIFL
ncbi:MAG TPA: CAAX prenyl protease-related protein [Myxococcota bacterium]|nr:CAAX prenyl protease-related protein [Myxococcota bacterium]